MRLRLRMRWRWRFGGRFWFSKGFRVFGVCLSILRVLGLRIVGEIKLRLRLRLR